MGTASLPISTKTLLLLLLKDPPGDEQKSLTVGALPPARLSTWISPHSESLEDQGKQMAAQSERQFRQQVAVGEPPPTTDMLAPSPFCIHLPGGVLQRGMDVCRPQYHKRWSRPSFCGLSGARKPFVSITHPSCPLQCQCIFPRILDTVLSTTPQKRQSRCGSISPT